jgi:hypothetical protein
VHTRAAKAIKLTSVARVVVKSGTPSYDSKTTVVSVVGAAGCAHANAVCVPLGLLLSLPTRASDPFKTQYFGLIPIEPLKLYHKLVLGEKIHSSINTGE